ncbi:MAG TPA: hypothetical protein VF230_12295, partial [Acidimicrobiales bacterium]
MAGMRAALSTVRWRGAGQAAVWLAVSAVFATVALLVVGSSLYLGAVGPASVDRQVATRCGPTAGMTVAATDVEPDRSDIDAKQRYVDGVAPGTLRDRARLLVAEGGEARSRRAGGYAEPVRLASKTGFIDHVDVVARGAAEGAYVPRRAAERLGVRPGDGLSLQTSTGDVTVPVAATYDDLRQPLDPYWCHQRLLLVPPDDLSQQTPPALVFLPEDALLRLAGDNGWRLTATFEATTATPSGSLASTRSAAEQVADVQQHAPADGPFAVDEHAHPVEVR